MYFSVGDLVILKSQSPVMTVVAIVDNTIKVVFWNPGLGKFDYAEFNTLLLAKVS